MTMKRNQPQVIYNNDENQLSKRLRWDGDHYVEPLQTKVTNLVESYSQPNQPSEPDPRSKSEQLRSVFVNDIWPKIFQDYQKMTLVLKRFVMRCLEQEGIVAEVLGRVKEAQSAKKTLKRREDNLIRDHKKGFDSLLDIFHEMHDLSGLRIVLQYRDDLEKARELIENLFESPKPLSHFDPDRAVSKLWKPWFRAYETWNHRVKLAKSNLAGQEDIQQYAGLMFEVQLTTFSDNLYNKLAHDLLYKAGPAPLTSQEEIVIDLSHGVASCFELCIRILKHKLDRDTEYTKVDTAENVSGITELRKTLGDRLAKEAQSTIDIFDRDFGDRPEVKVSLSELVTQQLNKQFKEQEQIAKDRACLKDLRLSDPRDDKKRIEQTKGDLLWDAYRWILDNESFQQWRNDYQSGLLWISSDPGKGKTMLLCGIIDELKEQATNISYFFCQATDSRINNHIAVLRGLIYLLVDRNRLLLRHLHEKYAKAGESLFKDANAWIALSEILTNILQDPILGTTYLIIDALDECLTGLPQLLRLINLTSKGNPTIKWIVSSRNWPEIGAQLNSATCLSLEDNEISVSAAVATYIQAKVQSLSDAHGYDHGKRSLVEHHPDGSETQDQGQAATVSFTVPSTYLESTARTMSESVFDNLDIESGAQPTVTLDTVDESTAKTETERPCDNSDLYSDVGSWGGVEPTVTDGFVEWLLDEILGHLPDVSVSDVLAAMSYEMLQEFAIRLGHEGGTIDHWSIMYTVHQEKVYRALAARLEPMDDEDNGERPALPGRAESEAGMTVNELVNRWVIDETVGEPNVDILRPPDPFQYPQERYEDARDQYRRYQDILEGSMARDWLLRTMRRNLMLRGIDPTVQKSIRNKVFSTLKDHMRYIKGSSKASSQVSTRISRKRGPMTYKACFDVQWNPVPFFERLQVTGELSPDILTVTGEGGIFQALSLRDYIEQTWPSTSIGFLKLIRDLLSNPLASHEVGSDNGYHLQLLLELGCLRVYANGTEYDIAEVAEQLAWLGSALQLPGQSNYSTYEPDISDYDDYTSPHNPLRKPRETVCFCLKFTESPLTLDNAENLDNGQCWKQLFNSIAIARGFPVPSRREGIFGLEMPLDIAADIIGAEKVVPFQDRLLIKGYSAMLYPTEVDLENGTTTWHLIKNHNGSRISYADPRIDMRCPDNVKKLGIEHLRRGQSIIGWCQNVRHIAGTKQASYDIKRSALTHPGTGWALDKIQLSGGYYITASCTFTPDPRVAPLKLETGKGVTSRLESLSSKYVILFDQLDRRAWLVDVPSAILHLVRTSISMDKKGNIPETYSKSEVPEKLDEYIEQLKGIPPGVRASMRILTNLKNLALNIREDDETPSIGGTAMYKLRDRVKELLGFMEQMCDHQADMRPGAVGDRIHTSHYRELVGFDFTDIAARERLCNPKGVQLEEGSNGWAYFTRAIHAVTLFGKGFGELLQPVVAEGKEPCSLCHWNSSPPKQQDVLAVSMADLALIHQGLENEEIWHDTKPGLRNIVGGLHWERPDSSFALCSCGPDGRKCPSRIQAFKRDSKKDWNWLSRSVTQDLPFDSVQVCKNGGILLSSRPEVLRKKQRHTLLHADQNMSRMVTGPPTTTMLGSQDGSSEQPSTLTAHLTAHPQLSTTFDSTHQDLSDLSVSSIIHSDQELTGEGHQYIPALPYPKREVETGSNTASKPDEQPQTQPSRPSTPQARLRDGQQEAQPICTTPPAHSLPIDPEGVGGNNPSARSTSKLRVMLQSAKGLNERLFQRLRGQQAAQATDSTPHAHSLPSDPAGPRARSTDKQSQPKALPRSFKAILKPRLQRPSK